MSSNSDLCGLNGLFPEPILISELGRDFKPEELKFIEKLDYRNNLGNKISKDTRVLEQACLTDVKRVLTKKVNDFVEQVYRPSTQIEVYITQSWVNLTEVEQYHHDHLHPNSFISGVLYVETDDEKDIISFIRKDKNLLQIHPQEFTLFNSPTWFYKVWPTSIILFPSYLTHSVPPKKHKGRRLSLSFNTYLRGTVGNTHELSELIMT